MYGKTSNSGGPALSPRSKMISLGLSAVDAPPVRYRPPVKAADFPFNQNDRTENEYTKQQPTQNNYNYDYDDRSNAYGNSYDNGYEQPTQYAPSDDDLRAQYMQLLADEAELNQQAKQQAERIQPVSQKSPVPLSDKERMVAKYAEYQKKMEADQTQGIEQTRQKYVRKSAADDVYANLPGLVIGNQHDKDTMFRNKRDAQAAYQQQLANDIRSKPVAMDRKAVDRRASSPESQHISLMSRIGDRTGNIAAEMEATEARRRDAQRLLSTHRDDVLNRLSEATSPENKKYRESLAHRSGHEAAKFEEAPYRFIGGSPDAAKDRKKAMQEQYLTQLLHDNGPPSQGRSTQVDPFAAYVNKTGQTGLMIGGYSMDEAQKGASQNEKHMKQEAYRRLLDQQRVQAEDLVRRDRAKYGKY